MLREVEHTIDKQFTNTMWVVAEIASFNEHRSGHCYLELVEKGEQSNEVVAKCRATIWARKFYQIKTYFSSVTEQELRVGLKVLVEVIVSFHVNYGFSLNIHSIDPAYTLGELMQKRLETIAQLKKDGVFSLNKELSFPIVPQRIAVISSASAAGFEDFTQHLQTNVYGYKFSCNLFQANMQGSQAVSSICLALNVIAEDYEQYDVVVVLRGGGSVLDMQAFDDYQLCHAFALSPLPIITGIGHERDESIADMVAYSRMKTPTAAATFLIQCLADYEGRLLQVVHQIEKSICNRLHTFHETIKSRQYHLLTKISSLLMAKRKTLEISEFRLQTGTFQQFSQMKKELNHALYRAKLSDPTRLLKKGYLIAKKENRILTSWTDVKEKDIIDLQGNEIVMKCQIMQKNTKTNNEEP